MTATSGTILGVYNGVSLTAAFANPSNSDLIHISNRNGIGILVSVNSAGTVTLNPATHTKGSCLGSYLASDATNTLAAIFASAWTNPSNLDIFQCYSEIASPASAGSGGMVLIGRLNYAGVYSTT